MLGAISRSAKEASRALGRASQLQQQRFLNIHEYQVQQTSKICLSSDAQLILATPAAHTSCVYREQN